MNLNGRLREKEYDGNITFLFPDPSQTQNPTSFLPSSSEAVIDSIGDFRKGEIDGNPSFIFNFLSHTDSPSSFYDSNNDDQSPRFICPSLRLTIQKLRNDIAPHESYRFNTSPLFPSKRSVDQQVQNMLDSDFPICKFPVVPFVLEEEYLDDYESEYDEEEEEEEEVVEEEEEEEVVEEEEEAAEEDDDDPGFEFCRACRREILVGKEYYLCDSCCQKFHKECVESPIVIKHPSHPFHSFQLHSITPYDLVCIVCITSLNNNPIKYFCPTNNMGMHTICAMMPIPIVINHQKCHPHPLTFFPKQAFLPCNVCGLIEESFPTYLCLQCVFVVHRDCVYFPHVIRISRHHHRISFISSVPSGEWFCGVCRREVDNHYGAYSCNKCDGYYVHSKCAVREDLWDGKELEGVPEEPEVDVDPFVRVADGIIDHFSHGHYLKLEIFGVYDEGKFCQACVLPIYQGNYYSCVDQCPFIVHEACASFQRKKYHPFHRHPLTLVTSNVVDEYYGELKGCFQCCACERISCGFVYECHEEENCSFQLDVRCASVSEPFEYQGHHQHSLFLALNPEEEKAALCYICRRQNSTLFPLRSMLNCIECKYVVICLTCATLPYKARYKYDKHFLTFQERKVRSDQSDWCDVCERKIILSENGGFYSCDDCCTSLHVDCLLGEKPYMKPGHTIKYLDKKFQILPNNTMSQPFCHVHHDRGHCRDRVVFKKDNMIFCSYDCEDDDEEEDEEDEEEEEDEENE